MKMFFINKHHFLEIEQVTISEYNNFEDKILLLLNHLL